MHSGQTEIDAAALPGTDWATQLHDERLWVRRHAAWTLAKDPHATAGAAQHLATALGDWDPAVRKWVGLALVSLGGEGLRALIDALQRGGPRARAQAAVVLGRLGPLARPAVPALREALSDESQATRSAASLALRALGQ